MKFLKKIFNKMGKKEVNNDIEFIVEEKVTPQNDIEEKKDSLPLVNSTLLNAPQKDFRITKVIGVNSELSEGDVMSINVDEKLYAGCQIESYNKSRGIIKLNCGKSVIKAKEI